MLGNKQLHAVTHGDFVYNKLSAVGLSCGYHVAKVESAEQIIPFYEQNHPNLIIIDSELEKIELEKVLKHLSYSHCPYAILFLGHNELVEQPYRGMKEIVADLNIIGHINKPLKTEDIMEHFEKVENEPQILNSETIKRGLSQGEFELYYQPIVNTKDQHFQGAEALIRWNHPTLGMIGPDKFIPIAEENTVIEDLTEWTFKVCLEQLNAWEKMGLSMRLAMNLSEKVVGHPAIADSLISLAKAYKIRNEDISLEITEKCCKNQMNDRNNSLNKLTHHGFKIAIDDFELKYFSLLEMLNLKINELKLNRVHIVDLDVNLNSQKIAKSIISLAHTLNFEMGATGIESLAIWEMLASLGCDHAQGYYICKPVSVAEFNKWLGIKQQA